MKPRASFVRRQLCMMLVPHRCSSGLRTKVSVSWCTPPPSCPRRTGPSAPGHDTAADTPPRSLQDHTNQHNTSQPHHTHRFTVTDSFPDRVINHRISVKHVLCMIMTHSNSTLSPLNQHSTPADIIKCTDIMDTHTKHLHSLQLLVHFTINSKETAWGLTVWKAERLFFLF